jgi:hypothetical protein
MGVPALLLVLVLGHAAGGRAAEDIDALTEPARTKKVADVIGESGFGLEFTGPPGEAGSWRLPALPSAGPPAWLAASPWAANLV